MLYAPRQESEVETGMEIVKAGAWWVGGVDLAQPNAFGGEKMGCVKSVNGGGL